MLYAYAVLHRKGRVDVCKTISSALTLNFASNHKNSRGCFEGCILGNGIKQRRKHNIPNEIKLAQKDILFTMPK